MDRADMRSVCPDAEHADVGQAGTGPSVLAVGVGQAEHASDTST